MQTQIHHKYFFPHTAEEIWKHLTNASLLEQWLMKNDFQPIIGYEFQFKSNPVPSIGFDGIVYCTVLEIIPFKKLSYSWKCGPGNGIITLDTIVRWTLHDKDGGTELELLQTGFTAKNQPIHSVMFEGWQQHIQKINDNINTEKHDATKA